jgi:membrane protease YdiL (CAAX protease family)
MPIGKAFIETHPVLTYFVLTFAISWGGVLLAVGLGGTAGTPDQPDPLFALEILAMLGGPSVAGVLVTGVVHGRAGLRELLSRLLRWRVGARWYAVALLAAPLVLAAVLLALSLTSPVFLPGVFESDDRASLLLFGTAAGLAVGFFEELGWTGFATPELRRRHSVLKTALVLGVVWGAWHILTNDLLAIHPYAGTLPPAPFVIARALGFLVGGLPAYRVLMGWVYDRTGSLLVAMLMHVSLTASTLIFQPLAMSGAALLVYDLVSSAAWWVVVAAVAVTRGGHTHLLRSKREYVHHHSR